jgi:hypothetical protein
MRKLTTADKQPLLLPDAEPQSVDVPLGGWDAISPISKMESKYALTLQNWVPRTGWMEIRPGYEAWCQGLAVSPVESLMTYRPDAAAEQLFAACGGLIYDVSTQGKALQQSIGPFAFNRWQYANYTPPLGASYLLMVNGSDGYYAYTGGVWSQPAVTGVSASLLININMHKQRLWFVQKNSTLAWFLPSGAIQGAATALDLGPYWNKGGFLVATGTWTIDGGLGPNDYFAAVSNRGQLALYSGTDPTNANAWQLVGVFDFPPPLGNRPFCRVGSDLWMISLEGVIPVSQGLPFDPSAVRSVAITTRIQNAMLQAAKTYQFNFGWEMITYPAEALAFLNVPIQANISQQQFVTNMMTGAWCQFTNWNFNTFAIFNDLLYAGDNNGNIQWVFQGPADLVAVIPSVMQCAFNYFGDTGRLKHITMVQPYLVTSGSIVPTIAIAADFNPAAPPNPAVSNITATGAMWDSALWDNASYAAGNSSLTQWLTVPGLGRALSIQMALNVVPSGAAGSSVFDTGVFDTMVFDGFAGQSQTLQVNGFNVMLEKGAVV